MADFKQILDAMNSVMGVIKTVIDAPGINALPYVSTISNAIGAMQTAYNAGKSIEPYLTAIKDTFGEGKQVPDQAKMDALDARIAELKKEAYAPLPSKEEGEEE